MLALPHLQVGMVPYSSTLNFLHDKFFTGRAGGRTAPGYPAAVASSRFQCAAVEYCDVPPPAADDARPLQDAGDHGNAWAINAQHEGKKVLGDGQVITVCAIVRHQKPTGQALLQRVTGIAGSQWVRVYRDPS